jgi:hypothetical protein
MSGTRYSESTLDQYMRMMARWSAHRAPVRRTGRPPDLRDPAHGPQRIAVIAPKTRGQRLDLPAAEEGEPWGGELPADPCDLF